MKWDLPEKLYPFATKKKRYKIAYGGRGGGKTETFARLLILKSFEHDKRILCCREVQRSINDSVYQVLKDIITEQDLQHKFTFTQNAITNNESGAEFIFAGLLNHTIDSLKSIKGILYCWVEESQSVSNNSWRVLIPTIREPNSEIWISFNRKRRNDPVWEKLCRHPSADTMLVYINYYDNGYFCDPLKAEMEKCKKNDPLEYRHVWLGEPEQTSNAQVYYNFDRDINLVDEPITHNPMAETWTGWDFGVSDSCAIWAIQFLQIPDAPNGLLINVIDYYENHGYDYKHYADWMKARPWYKECRNLRHAGDPSGTSRDSSLQSWIGNLQKEGIVIQRPASNSPEELASIANKYMKSVRVCEKQHPTGLDCFEEWMYPTDKKTNDKIIGVKPEHSKFSHGGTAFYFLMGVRFPVFGKSITRMI